MNPFNLLVNYVIANSRASFYNVPGNQEITNTALLTGMVSENPLMSYLIIDNKAKIEGEKFSAATTTTQPIRATPEAPGLPPASGTVVNPPTDTKGTETSTQDNTATLQAIRTEISENKTALATITAQFADLKSQISTIESDNKKLTEAVSGIQIKLDAISTAKPAPDTATASKNIVTQKASPKTDTK